ncbi:MAG: hypothetical protein PUJ24_09295 [Bacteroidales bacterium]|nr:hypothetical protein [Bacteroidales bacterium]
MEQDKLRELKIQLRRHMNGTTAAIMKGLDDAYAANYGLSLQHARDVAAQIELSPDDCDYLWGTRWRDFMLIAAAAMLQYDPEPERLMPWVAAIPSSEMVEMLPFLLTGKLSRAMSLAQSLALRSEGFDLAVALNTAARSLQSQGVTPASPGVVESLLSNAVARPSWSMPEAAALSFLARQCLRRNVEPALVTRVKEVALARPDAHSRLVAQQIDDEILLLNP